MSRPRTLTRVVLLFVMALVAFAARQTPAVSAAPPTDLFISEYLESTPGNRKAIEIYNGTSSAITLTSTYNVVLYVNGSATPASPINLTGSIPAGGVFVLAHTDTPAATGITANQTSGSLTFNGNDVVALRNGTTIVDVLGQIGNDPGAGGWGTDPTNTTDNTIRRKSTICAGDTNGTDAFNPATEYDGFVDGTTSGFGSHTANCSSGDEAPSITATNPVDNATNVAANTTITLNFSETVAIAGTVQVVGSVSLTQNLTPTTSDNMTFTLNPSAFTDGETVTVTVLGTQVTDLDTDEPPDNMAADFEFDFTIVSAVPICDQAFTPIYDIQGSGASVPTPGNVTTEGVVVGDFQTSAGVQGFFIQDPTGDANTATSDGIFVFTGTTDNTVNAGDYVRVEGYARERFNQTTLNGSNSNTAIVPAANIINCGTGSVSAVDVTMPFASTTFPEQYEGMLVRFPQTLVIAEYFNYDQFGEIVLALPLTGEDRPYTGTAIDEPGAPALARIAANAVRRITLDDNQGGSNPATLRHPNGNPFSLANMFRGGDHVANATGVLGYEFNLYRVFPTAPADYTAVNSRPASPEDVGGSLTVAAMNTLNFFITGDYPSNDPLDNKCGPSQTLECRGHDADQPTEFTRQRDKLLEALAGINADVIGLNEIENTPGVSPLGDPVNGVVAGLNDMLGAGTYAFIDTGVIGTDAIRVGLIYKPGSVTPVGSFQTLDSNDDPRFLDGRNRPALAQTFEEVGTGARFTVVVNHLKSKGSACTPDDPDLGDGQGNCNQTRLAAAQALVDWLATDPTGSGDPDFLIMGDLNSYAMEDPIDAIKLGSDDTANTSDDYVNLIAQFQGTYAYSYTFDGQAGYLDHALAINSLASQVTGAAEWHINSDESDAVDYDTTFKPPTQEALYEDNPYRSSDHDPVIIGLDLTPPPDTTAPTVTINQASGQVDPTGSSPINFTVVFSEPVIGFATGDVTLSGTAGATTATVTEVAPMDGTTYNVAVSGMTNDGTVIASVSASVADDAAGNDNVASTSTDNTVTYVVPVAPTEIYVSTEAAGTVGAVSYGSEDILKWDGSAWSVWFDGSDAGLEPKNAKHNINAFYIPETGDEVLITFAQNARIVPGISGKVDGMDIVRWDDTAHAFSLVFDGQDVGLTQLTNEKIDGLHELDPSLAPPAVQAAAGGSCVAYYLISPSGNGKVTNYDGTQLKITGEDVLGFCATQLGSTTAGKWHKLLDGKAEGVKPNAITSISASDDGQTLYFTTKAAFNVDGATGIHSMVYKYDMATGQFSGPYFSASANGLSGKVDGLHVAGDLP